MPSTAAWSRRSSPALAGSGKAFLQTSGSSIVADLAAGEPSDQVYDEDTPVRPLPGRKARVALNDAVLAAAKDGVRAVVICPSLIYGAGRGVNARSIQIPWLIALAKKHGVPKHIGRGENVWSNVHIDDLVDLYLLALDKAPPGAFYYAENGENSMREVCRAIGRMLGLGERTEPMTLEEAAAEWGEGAANYTMGSNSRVRARPRAPRAGLGAAPALAARGHRARLVQRSFVMGMHVMATSIEIRPTGAALGADVAGAALAAPSAATLQEVREALCDHLVLRFRGTDLDDADYVAFGRTFGEIEPPDAHTRTASMTDVEFPEMSVISNVVEGGVARGEAGDGELRWHTDHGFMERPAGFTMLLAREVPAKGGDTSFLNMYRAYEALPDDLRGRVEGRSLKHQASHGSTGQRRPGYLDLESDDPRDLPGAIHPIVRTHPETGRKALFLGRRFGSYIPPLPLEESEALLDELWAHATRDEFTWTQKWQVGDLIIWDNRCTMHRRDGFAGHGRRRMHRLMTLGERPV